MRKHATHGSVNLENSGGDEGAACEGATHGSLHPYFDKNPDHMSKMTASFVVVIRVIGGVSIFFTNETNDCERSPGNDVEHHSDDGDDVCRASKAST